MFLSGRSETRNTGSTPYPVLTIAAIWRSQAQFINMINFTGGGILFQCLDFC